MYAFQNHYLAVLTLSLAIAHIVLDLLTTGMQQTLSTNTSPRTPQSPAAHTAAKSHNVHNVQSSLQLHTYSTDSLMRLKIAMRKNEHKARRRDPVGQNPEIDGQQDTGSMGKNEGTVRFLFGPASTAV